jgi:hypothetical protein
MGSVLPCTLHVLIHSILRKWPPHGQVRLCSYPLPLSRRPLTRPEHLEHASFVSNHLPRLTTCLRHLTTSASKPTAMFIESRPVTGFGETAGWALPHMPQEPVERVPLRRLPSRTNNSSNPSLAGMEQSIPPTLKQPPLTTNDNAVKSSLDGYEQTIPPFKDFIRQTPPPEDSKFLPLTPLVVRRSSLADSSREPSPSAPRRTSSVYSRAVSQWFADSPTWSASDLADNPIPALPLEYLQPIAYSASTPQLKETTPAGLFLQPRTHQPLITTPSPTASRCTSRSPSPRRASSRKDLRISVLLPTAVDVAQIPRMHLRTVSLEKAKANSGAAGAEHLLPEEQRAKLKETVMPKARSLEPIVKPPVPITRVPITRDTMAMFGRSVDLGLNAPGLPSMTLVDAEGRDRVVGTPMLSVAPSPTFAFPVEPISSSSPTVNAFPVGNNAPRTMVSLAEQNQEEPFLEQDYAMSDRGRPTQRGSRGSDYNRYQHNGQRRRSSSIVNAQADAQRMSHEYHSMLAAEQHRQATASSASRSIASDAEVGTHTKMVPQPLFNGKLSVIASGQDKRSRYDSINSSVSPFTFHHHQQSNSSLSMQSQTSGSGYDYFPPPPQAPRAPRPPRLSTIAANRRRRSSMGMIPISPPFQYSLSPISPKATTTMPPNPQPRNMPPQRRNSDDNRMSTYWRIPTKGGGSELLFRRSKEKKPSGTAEIPGSSASPGLPLLGADIIAQRLQTPALTPERSPNVQEPWPVEHQQQQQQQQYQPDLPQPASIPSPLPSPGSRGKTSLHETRGGAKPEKELTAKQALFSRLTKSAVKYADKLTRPTGYESQSQTVKEEEEERERGRSITLANLHTLTHPNNNIARKESPHLHHHPQHHPASSPDNRKQRPSRASNPGLGWTNAAKPAFDDQQDHLLLLKQYQHPHPPQPGGQDDGGIGGSRKAKPQIAHVQYAPQQQQPQDQHPQKQFLRTPYPRPMEQFQPLPRPQTQPLARPPQSKDSKQQPQTRYTHTTAPARPLDGRSGSSGAYGPGLADDEGEGNVGGGGEAAGSSSNSRRSSLFSSFRREARRKAKAEKRRGEIKRSIRVVGVALGKAG